MFAMRMFFALAACQSFSTGFASPLVGDKTVGTKNYRPGVIPFNPSKHFTHLTLLKVRQLPDPPKPIVASPSTHTANLTVRATLRNTPTSTATM